MNNFVKKDVWRSLKQHTDARIALGRTGNSLPTKELLHFGMSHALAKDAIYKEMEVEKIQNFLREHNISSVLVSSRAKDKKEYLINPNLGRQLSEESSNLLLQQNVEKGNIAIIFADGLSAAAINLNAIPVLLEIRAALKGSKFNLSPVIIAKHARVALSDEIGESLKSDASIMLIGERPGLSSPDSLGVYLTWNPKKGCNDSERNCISNVRPQGLSYQQAAFKTFWLLKEAKKLNMSGIHLKDESPNLKMDTTDLVTLPHSTTK
jgi:ethanolamine ammonia-lyase small subunit